MAEARAPDLKNQAKEDYLKGMKYKDLAEKYGVTINTIKSWKQRYCWDRKSVHTKKKKGAPAGNKNAIGNKGGAAPLGNLNNIKHGAYQSLYPDMLNDEEKELYDKAPADADIDAEIKLLRLKIARLLNRDKTFFYDIFGNRLEKEISEEERLSGIVSAMDQLRRLVEVKAKIANDTARFEFDKYKADIELQLKRERLELDKSKVNGPEGKQDEDDNFIDALKGKTEEVWDDET